MRIALVLTALLSMPAFADDVELLRRGGQASVDALYAKANGAPDELLDQVCAQKDCHTSRLFWYTDLDEAEAAAHALATILRDRYVLYWYSVRPVPLVTIDMGDGRRIRQTITGNSVHYLLDEDG